MIALTVLLLGLLAVMLTAPLITGRILATAQSPIAEEKAPELDRIVFIDYAIDGSGGALARATVWYNTATKVISSAEIVFDSSEKRFISSTQSCAGIAGSPFDIRNVATMKLGMP